MNIYGNLVNYEHIWNNPCLCVYLLICPCKNQYDSVISYVHFSSIALAVWVTCTLRSYTLGFFFFLREKSKKVLRV